MSISESKVGGYLGYITVSWFGTHDLPPEDVSEYYDAVINMKLHAQRHNDLEALRVAFSYLLTHPEIDCEKFAGEYYGFDDEEMRHIIRYSYHTIWPELLIEPVEGMTFVP